MSVSGGNAFKEVTKKDNGFLFSLPFFYIKVKHSFRPRKTIEECVKNKVWVDFSPIFWPVTRKLHDCQW